MTEGIASRAPAIALLTSIADDKYLLGRRYAEWCTAAPALESAVAAAAMAQDEIGHARSLYPLLGDVPDGADLAEPENRVAFYNAPFLDAPFGSWIDFVAANFLFDTALTVLLEGALDSSFGGLRQRARRIVEEERLHWLHAEGWTRKLSGAGGAVREALAGSLQEVVGQSLALLSLSSSDLVSQRVLSDDASSLESRFRARVNPILSSCSLSPV